MVWGWARIESGPRWWIISKNKTPNNTAVIIIIINTSKEVFRPKSAPTFMLLTYNQRLLPLVGADLAHPYTLPCHSRRIQFWLDKLFSRVYHIDNFRSVVWLVYYLVFPQS